MKTIEITVSPVGEIKIETKGFSGSGCKTATRDLETALGVVSSDKLTSEYYQQESQQTKLSQ
jgi:Protein of unknown function (DUF2997)